MVSTFIPNVTRRSGNAGFKAIFCFGEHVMKLQKLTLLLMLTFIPTEGTVDRGLSDPPHHHPLHSLSCIQIPPSHDPHMACLIDGWFQLTNPRPFVDNPPDATSMSPRKTKSYLTVYDSCAALGLIASKVWIDSELRIYNQNLDIEDQVIHIHGRFSVLPADEDKASCLQVEVHRFVSDALDPRGANLPEAHCTSVTIFGRVASAVEVAGTADKFFTLEVSDYIRDHNQTFNIR